MFGGKVGKVSLDQVATLINGDRGKNYPSRDEFIDNGIPFINAGHLSSGRVRFDKMNYIEQETYDRLRSGKIRKGDILYCLRGSLGKCAIVDFDSRAIASSLLIIRPNPGKLLTSYLYYALISNDALRQMQASDNGSSQPNLSAKSVGSFRIPFPSLALQKEFGFFVTQVDKLRFDALRQRGPVLTMLSKCGEFPEMIEIKYAEIGKMNKIKSANFGEWDVQKKDLQQTPHMEKAILRQHRPTC